MPRCNEVQQGLFTLVSRTDDHLWNLISEVCASFNWWWRSQSAVSPLVAPAFVRATSNLQPPLKENLPLLCIHPPSRLTGCVGILLSVSLASQWICDCIDTRSQIWITANRYVCLSGNSASKCSPHGQRNKHKNKRSAPTQAALRTENNLAVFCRFDASEN